MRIKDRFMLFSSSNDKIKSSSKIQNLNKKNQAKISQLCSNINDKKTCINSKMIEIMRELPGLRKNSVCIGNTNCLNQ